MADSEDYPTLSTLFDRGLALYEEVTESSEDTNSKNVQEKVLKAKLMLEDATRFVSELAVFSDNEEISEVSTASIKFFLLPALLGQLTLKTTGEERIEIIRVAEVYFVDFLRRCKQFGLTNVEVSEPGQEVSVQNGPSARPSGPPTPAQLAGMAKDRESKIRRFKEMKLLDETLKQMRKSKHYLSDDEELVRTFFLSLIQKFTYECVDELASLRQEKEVLAFMAARGPAAAARSSSEESKGKSRPLRPFILTRDDIQKKVYGLGYPSLPTLSIEEFYDKRVAEGWFPDPAKRGPAKSLIQQAQEGEEATRRAEEEEVLRKERLVEDDDEEELARKRAWDEWRDCHKRGEGNTYNRS